MIVSLSSQRVLMTFIIKLSCNNQQAYTKDDKAAVEKLLTQQGCLTQNKLLKSLITRTKL